MAVKIRLARHGRKRYAYYHIVVADHRSPRDGRYIERIGSYNPNSNPATIDLNFDKALEWVLKGAQPSDTVRRILSYKGVLMKKHLLDGVKKGAFDEAEAERRFEMWIKDKTSKIDQKIDSLEKEQKDLEKSRLEAEKKINEERAAAIAKKYAEEAKLIEEENKAEQQSEENAEVAAEEKADAKVEEKPEEKPEAKPEEKSEKKSEEPKAEAEEDKKEQTKE